MATVYVFKLNWNVLSRDEFKVMFKTKVLVSKRGWLTFLNDTVVLLTLQQCAAIAAVT